MLDNHDPEAVRLRIATAIGRDSTFITSADKVRHFDGISFVVFYGGQLFLTFVTAALPKLWDKVQEEGAKKLVNVAWEKAAEVLKSALGRGEVTSNAEQIERIRDVSSGVAQLGCEIGKQYLETFISAGQAAVEARLRHDNLSDASAARIAAAVAQEVETKLAAG